MEEEISLQDIVLRLWARRGFIVASVLIAALATAAWLLYQLGSTSGDVVYYIDLKGIDRGQYPGGAAFSPNDLNSPEVLQASMEAAGLAPEQLDGISGSLRVEYGSPETPGIVQKYRARLSARNLTSSEIDARNAEFTDELERATGSSLSLAVNPSVAGLGESTARRLLQELPAQWSRVYSERYRIYQTAELRSSAVTSRGESLHDPMGVISAITTLETVETGLKAMASDNRISHLVSSSGYSASELLDRFSVFQNVQFRPLLQAVLSHSHPLTDSYRSNLELEIQYLEAQILSLTSIADELSRGREGAAAEWADSAGATAVNQLQLSGDSLGTIIALAEQASSAEFLREIMMARHDLATDLAGARVQLARVPVSDRRPVTAAFIAAVEERQASVVSDYEDLYATCIEKLRVDLGNLYSAAAAPTKARDIDLLKVVMKLTGVILAVLFVTILLVLVMPESRAGKGRASPVAENELRQDGPRED